jgi:two-component system sensor histidine kinase KdpD
LKSADQVVNLDLAVEDLQERLKSGKIYTPDKIQQALKGFFQQENLSTLRELALREVAETLDRASGMRRSGEQPASGSPIGRVMVCLSSFPPRAAVLLRRGSRMAGRLNTDWFVVYVETPEEAPHLIDAEAQRHLLANMDKARELGAEVVRLHGKDPVEALIDFARSHGVGLIVVGRSHLPKWRTLFKLSTDLRLVREAHGFDVQVVSFDPKEAKK